MRAATEGLRLAVLRCGMIGGVAGPADVVEDRPLYGCMALGGTWDSRPYGRAEIAEAEAAIGAALDSGFTTFDHADIYRHGKAGAVFGEILARSPELRERIVLQTKCGIRLPEGDRAGFYDLRGETIIRRVEESLRRLRTDVIDVLLLHRPDPLADPEDIARAVSTCQQFTGRASCAPPEGLRCPDAADRGLRLDAVRGTGGGRERRR
jgi:hypothetical protein